MPGRPRRRSPRWLLGAVVAATLLVLVGQDRSGAPSDAEPELVFPPRGGVESFRLVYRVETTDGPESTIGWEERLVRRPFDGRLIGFSERPARRSQRGAGTLTTASGIFLVAESGTASEVAGRVHGPPVGDFGFLTVLHDLVAEGVVVDQGRTAAVVGRPCRLYRTFEPLSLSRAAPTATSYDELCIDRGGVVLREQWVVDGEVLLLREAVEFDESPAEELLEVFDDAAAEGSSPPEPMRLRDRSGGVLNRPPRPRGFREVGQFGFAPDPQTAARSGGFYQSVYWVYIRGTDYLVVEGGTGALPFSLDTGRRVKVPGLGTARLVVGEQGAEARLAIGAGKWVRVRASAPIAWIERYLSTLTIAG